MPKARRSGTRTIIRILAPACLAGVFAHAFSAGGGTVPARRIDVTTYRLIPGVSSASYAVDEVFFRENNRLFTAVGVTREVSGEILIDRARPAASRVGEIVVDLSQLTSDDRRRDRALREKYLDTHRWPHARLSGATLHGMPPAIAEGQSFRYTIAGELAVHGVTRPTTWRGDAVLAGDTLRGTAKTDIKMSDFGIEVPSLLSLRAADKVSLELRFTAIAARAAPVGGSPKQGSHRRSSRAPRLISVEEGS